MPCPTHEELLALAFERLDGNGPADEHVTDCAACKDTLTAYVNVLRGLQQVDRKQALASATHACLDDNDLAAYADGGLAKNDCERVEAHFVKCATCLDNFVQLSSILSEVVGEAKSPVAFVLELAQKSLRLISHPSEGFNAANLAPANVLGSEKLGQESTARVQAWSQQIGNYAISVSTTQTDAFHATVSLTVKEHGEPLSGAALYLRSEGRTVQSEMLDDNGNATIEALALGSYECAVAVPGQTAIAFELMLIGTE
jgi:hypothetical protein